ncbi:MAG: hypothetical protein WBJ84_07535 [Bacteroidales bacterium]
MKQKKLMLRSLYLIKKDNYSLLFARKTMFSRYHSQYFPVNHW